MIDGYKEWRDQQDLIEARQSLIDDGVKVTGYFGPHEFSVSIDGRGLIALVAYFADAIAKRHDSR